METRLSRFLMPGAPPSSWCGAAPSRPGPTSYSSCFALLCQDRYSHHVCKFFHGLRPSASHEVQVLSRFLARDRRSVTGRNLWLIHELTNLNPWAAQYGRLRAALHAEKIVAVPDQDRWRLQYLVFSGREGRPITRCWIMK